MKHLLRRAYAAQRLVSWRRHAWRQWAEWLDEVGMASMYFFLLGLLAIAMRMRG